MVRFAALVVAVVVLSSCANDLSRADAITALQTTGVTEAEATCMADSLAALDQLDAADPREPRTEVRREAFVTASSRCVTTEVLASTLESEPGAVVVSASVEPDAGNTPHVEIGSGGQAVVAGPGGADIDIEADAIAELQRQGRSEQNATCIVEFLIGAQASHLFAESTFGLGSDPLEANAIAACLSQR